MSIRLETECALAPSPLGLVANFYMGKQYENTDGRLGSSSPRRIVNNHLGSGNEPVIDRIRRPRVRRTPDSVLLRRATPGQQFCYIFAEDART